MHPPPQTTGSGQWQPTAPTTLADPGIRFAARLLDTVFTFCCTIVLGILITGIYAGLYRGDMDKAGPEYGVPMLTMIIGTPFVYEWLQVTKWGGTLGKRITGIQVVRAADGGRVPAGHAAVRALCYSPGIYYAPNFVPVLAQLNVLWLLW